MKPTLKIASNPTVGKVFGADEAALLECHRLLSYNVPGAQHMAAFAGNGGGWDGKSSFFDYKAATFPAGFVHLVTAGLRKAGYPVQLVRKPLPEPLGTPMPDVDGLGYSDQFDYQPEAVRQLLKHGQVTIQVATGGGKSRIARIAMAWVKRRTLFLTTRSVLLYQMHAELEKMTGGAPVAILGDGEWGIEYRKDDGTPGRRLSQFNVGMVQTLSQRLAAPDPTSCLPDQQAQLARRQQALDVLSKFEFVILEEAHECSSDQFWSVMMACKNAAYRMALTATPFMKDEESNLRLLGCAGPVALTISEKMLIDRGVLARPYFKFLRLTEAAKPKKLYKSTPYQPAYKFGIVENEERNRKIAAEVGRFVLKYGLSGMVLVQRKEHGRVLQELFTRLGLRAEFIWGESSARERRRTLDRLAAGELDVLIGSTILDVGVDVPSVGFVVLAGAGKAEVATRQRIGRGLRRKKVGPNVAFVVDVADEFNAHLKAHAAERRAIIENTPGFSDNIVEDFDFAALGLERRAA